tara:strand:+ start:73 stop:390 length:318 start_codon:yes stop_codon:yes gene_type:complete
MKKYLNQTTVNVLAIVGAAAWGLCFLGSVTETFSKGGSSKAFKDQVVANKKLDHDIARVKHCGQIIRSGIRISENSPTYSVCADVTVLAPEWAPPAPPAPQEPAE